MVKRIILLIISFTFVLSFKGNVYSQWIELNTGISFTIFSLSAIDNSVVWACSSGPNIIRTTDGGTTWVNLGGNVPAPYGVETNIYAFDQNTAIFACYAGSPNVAYVYKTTNAGQNWPLVFTQNPGFITGISMKNATQGFMVGWPQGGRWSLWRTNNAGNNWDSTGLYIPESNSSYWSFENSVFYLSSNIWFGARGKGVYYSTNDGNSWVLQDLTSGGFPYPSAIWFENLTTGYCSAQLNVIKTTNSGGNWNALPGSTGTEVVRGIVSQGNEIWYVREITPSIFYSSNSGNSWIVQHTSPSGTGYRFITKSRNGNTLWACTILGEVAKYVLPTGINPVSRSVPDSYRLYQNYPNPFNPITKIHFSIPPSKGDRGMNVNLIIYDILGRELATLVNESLKPGSYEVEWDGSNFASGIYFYKLIAGDFVDVKKMVLLM